MQQPVFSLTTLFSEEHHGERLNRRISFLETVKWDFLGWQYGSDLFWTAKAEPWENLYSGCLSYVDLLNECSSL